MKQKERREWRKDAISISSAFCRKWEEIEIRLEQWRRTPDIFYTGMSNSICRNPAYALTLFKQNITHMYTHLWKSTWQFLTHFFISVFFVFLLPPLPSINLSDIGCVRLTKDSSSARWLAGRSTDRLKGNSAETTDVRGLLNVIYSSAHLQSRYCRW